MASSNFTSIPIIDLGKAKDPETRPELLRELRDVLTNVGFLYVSNHGVASAAIQDLIDALPRLFNLSAEEKTEVALVNSPHFLGYSGTGAEKTAGKVDQREQFEYATELPDEWKEGKPLYERLKGPNQVNHRIDASCGMKTSDQWYSGRQNIQIYDQLWKHTSQNLRSSARTSCFS